ncbi:MAG: metallophosphatase [Phormidesmis sp.]
MVWAILSGIEGNLAAYKAVLKDIQQQRVSVEELYILGDLIGPRPESEELVGYIRQQRSLPPQICLGWWEEQLFNLHALRHDPDAVALKEKYGAEAVEQLWNAVSRDTTNWLRGLDFGFFELDCLLIHGSTLGCDDELTPTTNPLTLLDRLLRTDANSLFCGRSGLAFQYQLSEAQITSTVETLGAAQSPGIPQQHSLKPRQIIGVGNVGRLAGYASYTLYNPNTGNVQFQQVTYRESLNPVSASGAKDSHNTGRTDA